MILLYWDIGRSISQDQKREGWGAKVIDRLAFDLSHAFPDMQGFSLTTKLEIYGSFASAWTDRAIVQGPLAQITWYHNIALLTDLNDPRTRRWYAQQADNHLEVPFLRKVKFAC